MSIDCVRTRGGWGFNDLRTLDTEVRAYKGGRLLSWRKFVRAYLMESPQKKYYVSIVHTHSDQKCRAKHILNRFTKRAWVEEILE